MTVHSAAAANYNSIYPIPFPPQPGVIAPAYSSKHPDLHDLAGSSITKAASSLVSFYDRNGDGSITVDGFNDETSRTTRTPFATTKSSIERLARGADQLVGNNDGKASQAEIAELMRRYDTGDSSLGGIMDIFHGARDVAGDGRLTGAELRQMEASFGQTKTTADNYWDHWKQLPPSAPASPPPGGWLNDFDHGRKIPLNQLDHASLTRAASVA